MSTDIREEIRTKDEYAESIVLSYPPSILSLPNKKRIILSEADKINYKDFSVENDSVIPSFLNSEMTEVNSVKVSSTSRTFNAYAKAINLIKSNYRNANVNVQSFHDQVIRQLSIQFDNMALAGEGGNNGLIVSSDANVLVPSSAEIPTVSGAGFNQVLKAKNIATGLNILVNDYTASLNLTVFFYGSALMSFLGNITEGQENDIRSHVRQAFSGKSVTFVDIPALALSGISGNGMIIASNELVTLEHCGLPKIERDGVNEEKNYYWASYSLGSVNVRPEVKGAIIKQAITFA